MRKLLAWSAHAYTALGLIAASMIALAIFDGDYRMAFFYMLAATMIDATDGTYARAVGVKTVLPGFDGRRLDDLIDFHTFTTLPLLLIWHAKLLPPGYDWCLVVALLASAYGFCQAETKTADGYFLGFPSYWNIVAFYLYALPWPSTWAAVVILILAVLTFVPTVYLYPSQRGRLNLITSALGSIWAAALVAAILWMPSERRTTIDPLTLATLSYPAYYMAASAWVTWQRWAA
ncbi:MAG: CDP-alcohol phosphatidyltransferase family protein [Gemmataceae bacterium]